VVVPAHGFPAVAPSAVEDVVVLVLPPAALAGDVGAAKDQGGVGHGGILRRAA